MDSSKFTKVSGGFFVDSDFVKAFRNKGLTSIDAVFNFSDGKELAKSNIAKHRSRIEFDLNESAETLFLKKYDRPAIMEQLKNWISHHKWASTSSFDRLPTEELSQAGINTPKIIAYGEQWCGIFEKRSFIITQKVPQGQSLEKKLPDFFYNSGPTQNVQNKREFINQLADFVRRFHQTGYRHRDLYFAHIFLTGSDDFYLIDLQRTFKPILFKQRFRVKDITQLYYSACGQYFSRSDRLRFYLRYARKEKLNFSDKLFFRSVKAKARRMANHDIKHGRPVPFAM